MRRGLGAALALALACASVAHAQDGEPAQSSSSERPARTRTETQRRSPRAARDAGADEPAPRDRRGTHASETPRSSTPVERAPRGETESAPGEDAAGARTTRSAPRSGSPATSAQRAGAPTHSLTSSAQTSDARGSGSPSAETADPQPSTAQTSDARRSGSPSAETADPQPSTAQTSAARAPSSAERTGARATSDHGSTTESAQATQASGATPEASDPAGAESPASRTASPSEPADPTRPSADTTQPAIEQRIPPAASLDGGVPLDASAIAEDAAALEPDAGAIEPDAGALASPIVPDAGAAPAATPERPESDSLTALITALIFEHERDAEREAARRSRAEPQRTPPPEGGRADESRVNELIDRAIDWLDFAPPERRVSTFGLIFLLCLALLALWMIERARRPLPDRGLMPRVLSMLRIVLRLVAVSLVLMLVSRVLPRSLQPALLLTVAGAAIALGFGAVWILLPDVMGWLVLLTEGRLRPGQWIAGEGFAGTVEQLGPRVTVLRAPDGALLTVPNRRVVKSPLHASDRRWHEVEVELRAPGHVPAPIVREAIRDAVLCSPHVPPDPRLAIARDPREPQRWRVRVRLLDVRFTTAFEGQLLERVEEIVAKTSGTVAP